jgi:hypothetical protein
MSSQYDSTPSASSYPTQSRESQRRHRPTDTNSGNNAQQTVSSQQAQNIEPVFAGSSRATTNPPAYGEDTGPPPTYRKLTQIEELVESLQSQMKTFTQEASNKADDAHRHRNFGGRRQRATDALQHRSMASFGAEALNYMRSGSVSHLGAAHEHLKSIVEGNPSVTEANEEFCKLRTDAFLVAALPSVKEPDSFTWAEDKRIRSPDREARLFWTRGLDSKSQWTIAKIKMSS